MYLLLKLDFVLLIVLSIPLSIVSSFHPASAINFGSTVPTLTSPQRHPPQHLSLSMSDQKEETDLTASSEKTTSFSQIDWLKTIGSTTSAVVAGTFYIVLAWKRDALMVSFFIGSISNGILSKVLKKLLKQERPAELVLSDLELPPSDNGMPSSHAMSLGFIGTFTMLQLPWTVVPILTYVIISLVYRVKSNLHTLEQVLVGVTLGSLNGIVWRSLCLGTNPWRISIMDWVTAHFLNQQGLLPWYGLAVPALLGAAVVGSVERRISRFLDQRHTKRE